MQNQAILAGLRALVEQIDHLERQNALHSRNTAPRHAGLGGHSTALINTNLQAATVSDRVSVSAPSLAAPRHGAGETKSRATNIASRLGVSNRNFFHVAHAVGRGASYAN